MDVVNSLLRAARSGNLKRVIEFVEDDLVDINSSNQNGLTALHSASREGHTRVVEELITRGANVHAKTLKGNTALHIASLAGQEAVVRVLIDNGADVDAQSASGFTALYMAAQENHQSIVKLLLAGGANQNIATTDGFTPLAVAMQQGHEQVASILLNNEAKGRIRFPGTTESGRSLLHIAAKKDDCAAAALLIQNNISPDIASKSGFTALHVASHYGNEAVAKLLIDRQADVNYRAKHNITPLHVAAKWGRDKLVDLLLDNRAKIDAITRDGLTPLHCAARSGHDQVLEKLIKRGAPISAKTRSGLAPLHMATQGDHLRSAQILLNNKAPVDDVTIDYLTALHVASHCGHVKVAKLLLNNKADPNFRALNGFTSLHIACKKNRLKIVELLLKYGASLSAITESGLTPLHVGAFMGCVQIVIYLLENQANIEAVTIRGETPLHLATRANQIEVIDVLLRYGANVGARAKESQTALHIASRLGNEQIAKLLIDQGIDVDAPTKDSYTALHIASKEGHEQVVALLLEHGSNIACATRNHGFTPLHLASKYGIDNVVDLLLSYGAPVDAQGKNGVTPLHVATHYDHPSVVQLLLLDRGPQFPGASPHAMAKNGYTALHIAAKGNRLDIADAILQYGANPNAESRAGFCPLHLASQEGRVDMANLLLNNGAKVNCRAKNGITPLHLCAQEDQVEVAQLLVKRGAHLDARTKGGFTPLHVASHFARLRMIKFLLANGADVNIPAASGYTPLHQASQQGNPQIVELLLRYSAKPDALTENGQTALSIAENLGYVSLIDTLRVVTETVVKTTTTTITEEKYKIVAPETMQETFDSDSEDEAADDTRAHQESVKFLTTDVMKNFNSTNMGDDYSTSQSNLNAAGEQQATRRTQQADGSSQHFGADSPEPLDYQQQQQQFEQQQRLAAGRGGGSGIIVEEMGPDLHYLNHEAPLDGGESTFGAYSTLGGAGAPNTTQTTTTHEFSRTVRRTESGTVLEEEPAAHIYSDDDDEQQQQQLHEQQAAEAFDYRLDGDELNGSSAPGHTRRETESPLERTQFVRSESVRAVEQMPPDNVDIERPLQQAGFLVSFMVDARGGAMRGCRHSGVRVIIPPGAAPMPMRITCRYLRRERLVHPPPLMEGEACASKILEVGPAGARFLAPVLIEVPHFASLRGKEREIIILRSDSGEVWREHLVEADDKLIEQMIRAGEEAEERVRADEQQRAQMAGDDERENWRPSSGLGGRLSPFDGYESSAGQENSSNRQQQQQRLTKIVTTEFPQYFAIISRIKQEVHTVGPDGSAVDSQVVPKVQAIFTDGALTKRIKIGLQAQCVPSELVMKLFGSLSAITFSPIVTIEPRRRKFHCPIRLKIPLPASYHPERSQNLRLLCSITGGQSKAIWEDVTGSTPLSITDKCLLFTTTVSARFWLVHCQRQQRCQDAARFAQELWRHLIRVPFMAKFVIFAKRRDINEAQVRAFCMTDDREERTLEVQEHYTLVARSREVEVLDNQMLYLEFAGNLLPTHLATDSRGRMVNSQALINEQLSFAFRSFQENRIAFAVRLKEVGQEPSGRIAFMEDSIKWLASLNPQQRAYLNERRRRAVCTLGVHLPAICVHYDNILGTPKRNSYYASAKIGDLTLADIAAELANPLDRHQQQENVFANTELDSLAGSQLTDYETGGSQLMGRDHQRKPQLPDWMELAPRVGIPRDEVEFIAEHCAADAKTSLQQVSPALLFLMHWFRLSNPEDRDQDLARGLMAIGRGDIAHKLNFPIEPKRMSRSTMELLREIEAIPVRSTENLYAGSELSGYGGAHHLSGGRGASLRRFDQAPEPLGQAVQHQRSGSTGRLSQQARPMASDDFDRRIHETRISSAQEWIQTSVQENYLGDSASPSKSKRQARKRG